MAQTLRELKFINYWLGGNSVTLQGLSHLLGPAAQHAKPLTIADLGCGGGDMLVLMANWAGNEKLPVRFTGVDANAYIISYAAQNTTAFPEVSYSNLNIFSDAFGGSNTM